MAAKPARRSRRWDGVPTPAAPQAPRRPEAPERERAAHRLLVGVLLGLLLLTLARGPVQRRAPLRPVAPLRVDLAHDGAGRLTAVPGLGPRRVARLLAARALRGAPRSVGEVAEALGVSLHVLSTLAATREVDLLLGGRALAPLLAEPQR